MQNKQNIFEGTLFEEVQNFKGDYIDAIDPGAYRLNEMGHGEMSTLEKTLYTLYFRAEQRECSMLSKILSFEVTPDALQSNPQKIEMQVAKKASKDQTHDLIALSNKKKAFADIMWTLITSRIPPTERTNTYFFRSNFIICSYLNISALDNEKVYGIELHFTK